MRNATLSPRAAGRRPPTRALPTISSNWSARSGYWRRNRPRDRDTPIALGSASFGADAPGEVGCAARAAALQQFEDAAQQLAALERCGDEIVGVRVAALGRRAGIDGVERLQPGLPGARPTHRG